MTDSIKPPHAISIWASKEILYVELPNAINDDSIARHTIKLPLNVYGLTQVVNLLRSRSSTSRLGERGDPTQHQADKEIRQMQRAVINYTGPIKRERKVEVDPTLSAKIKDVIRRFVNV